MSNNDKTIFDQFKDDCVDFYFDKYQKGYEMRDDWTDEDITISTCKGDIDKCVEVMRKRLYEYFDIKEGD